MTDWGNLSLAAPGGDGAVDVGRDAGDDVGGGVEEPLQPDAVQRCGDQAHFDLDLGRREGFDVADLDRLAQVSGEGGEVGRVALRDEGVRGVGRAGGFGRNRGEQLEQAPVVLVGGHDLG